MEIRKYSKRESILATRGLAADILRDLDTPKSLSIALMLRYGDFSDLQNIAPEICHYDYDMPESFELDYKAFQLLRKSSGLIEGFELKAAALSKANKAEAANAMTNELFSRRTSGNFKFLPQTERIMFYARSYIAQLLGNSPFAEHDAGFGPGATIACKGEGTHLLFKSATFPICTTSVWPYLRSYLAQCNVFSSSIAGLELQTQVAGPFSIWTPVHVEYNKLTTVPKDFRGDRVICIEPDGNVFVQKQIGRWIRSALRSAGLNLNTRQPVNGRLARQGSLDDTLSTIDFSSASDMISTGLVRELLPDYAFNMMDSARCKYTRWPTAKGEPADIRRNAKFSSMGNGFTFELETLVFLGLLYGSFKEAGHRMHLHDSPHTNASVFGDDVICPTRVGEIFVECCRCVGFMVNLEKTFVKGPFRESCGYDYFNGIRITSFRIKELITDEFRRVDYANRLRDRFLIQGFTDNRIKRSWNNLIRPIERKRYGPMHSFNTVIWVSIFDVPYIRAYHNFRMWIKVPRVIPRRENGVFSEDTTLTAMLYVSPSSLSKAKKGDSSYVSIKDRSIDHYDLSAGTWLP